MTTQTTPTTAIRKTAQQKLCEAGAGWEWVKTLAGLIKPWLATVFAVVAMAVALVVLGTDAIPQVTDIADPSSAGEVRRRVGFGSAFWACEAVLLIALSFGRVVLFRDRLRTPPTLAPDLRLWLRALTVFSIACAFAILLDGNLPPDWILGGWYSLGAWLLGVFVLAQANLLQSQADDGRTPGQILGARSPLPLDGWIDRWVHRRGGKGRTPEQRFVVLVILLWALASLPALSAIFFLFLMDTRSVLSPDALTHGWRGVFTLGPEDSPTMNHLSFVCLLSLASLLSLMVGLWQLAKHERLGWPTPLMPWLPAWVLFLGFFSACWPDYGKGLSDAGPPRPPLPTSYLFLGGDSHSAGDSARTRRPDHPKAVDCKAAPPLVLISASGGGSRAALFTAGIFSRMWWERPEEGYPCRALLIGADALSSVSGGSLAAAYQEEYLRRWMVNHGIAPDPEKSISAVAAWNYRKAALDGLFGDGGVESGPTRAYPFPNGRPQLAEAMARGPEPWAGPWDGTKDQKDILQTFDDAPYFCGMRQDFTSAAVAGFFQPWYGRGRNLENFWAHDFGWDRGKAPLTLSQFRPFEQVGLLPALILDSTITNSGSRLAITNVDRSCFRAADKFGFDADVTAVGDSGTAAGAARARRYDPPPFQINTLASLRPGWDIPLAAAVRASANVPFAFATIRFPRTTPGQGDRVLELTDGGVLDNTAVDATMALVRAEEPSLVPGLGRAKQPVLIFQIDSGELPTDPRARWWDPIDHHLEEPQRAMWRTNLNLQADVHRLYLEELCRLYGVHDRSLIKAVRMPVSLDPHEKPITYTLGFVTPEFAFFRVRAGELLGEHVTTAWHLPASERYRLYGIIMAPQQGATIRAAALWQKNPEAFMKMASMAGDVRIEPVGMLQPGHTGPKAD